jgi:endo-1,4-beta-xylanase
MNHVPIRSQGRPRGRVGLAIGGACAVVLALIAAVQPGIANAATPVCSNQSVTSGGLYHQMWSNGQGSACITLNSDTNYSTTWSGIGDFVAGAGWNPGSTNRSISYTGSLSGSSGTALMTLYGWSTSPLVEYYVIDNWVGSPNRAGTLMGQVTSDGGTYDIIEHQQVNQPSIQGTATFNQYLAIRTSKRSSGTITFGNFVSAWASHGMNLGTMNYQMMATEAWGGGSGSSSVSLGTASTPPPTSAPPTSPPPTTGAPGGSGCRATYSVVNSWAGGYQANVVVANAGSSALNGWTVHLTLAGGQAISSLWSGVNTGTSGAVTVKNASYNGAIAGGASTSFGYTATGDGSGAPTNVSCTSP